jgi:hypothetical protein
MLLTVKLLARIFSVNQSTFRLVLQKITACVVTAAAAAAGQGSAQSAAAAGETAAKGGQAECKARPNGSAFVQPGLCVKLTCVMVSVS